MRFSIEAIVVWPRDESLEARVVPFKAGCVNVLTGRSRSGKSSVVGIIDYCLGAGKCTIPVGLIREHSCWFGVRVDVDGTKYLVARKEPGEAVTSSSYCVREGDQAESLEVPEKTNTVESVKALFDRLAALPSVDFKAGAGVAGFSGRPSFRDMAAFNFQPQHVVANPFTLFFKTETTEHREKLRTIFPLVLGAIDASHLRAEHELKLVERQLKERAAELEERRKAVRAWQDEAFALYGRAKELSLLPSPGDPASLEECLTALRRVAAVRELPSYKVGSTGEAGEELVNLRERDHALDAELGDLRRRLVRLQELRTEIKNYRRVVGRQVGRLDSVNWFRDRLTGENGCPICHSTSSAAMGEVKMLEAASEQLATELAGVEDTPSVLEKEEVGTLEEIVSVEEDLKAVRARRAELERSIREEAGRRQRLEAVFRFIGRLEQAVKNFEQSRDDSSLVGEIEVLRERAERLRQVVDRAARRAREQAALRFISRELGGLAAKLDLERAGDAIDLKIRQLSLSFQNLETKRQDFLWEIGSGENWMGYHVATLLALHSFFQREDASSGSPVPSFLVIDQPSQVYFPSGKFDEIDAESSSRPLSSDERLLRRVFRVLAEWVRKEPPFPQVIVLEHAGRQVWDGIEGVSLVEEWRGDVDLLIPRAWIA